MSRRPNARQRANARLAEARADAIKLPDGLSERRRVPLAGYEELYEITRDGYVYSIRAERFVKWAYFESSPYIKIEVNGESQSLDIKTAVEDSWKGIGPQLYRVEVPATAYVVLAMDRAEAERVAVNAMRDEIRDGHLAIAVAAVRSVGDVPEGWSDGVPYRGSDADGTDSRTVETLLRERELSLGPTDVPPTRGRASEA